MTEETFIDKAFRVVIVIKALDGALEIVGAALLFLVDPATLARLAVALTQHELSQDPHDFIATHLLKAVTDLHGSAAVFGGLYLLVHGVVKVTLSLAALKRKLWAYPWMIGFLTVFIVYQCYRLVLAPTIGLGLLTTFDVFVVWLTYKEYRHLQA
jgi:uncharacterized membrane protein